MRTHLLRLQKGLYEKARQAFGPRGFNAGVVRALEEHLGLVDIIPDSDDGDDIKEDDIKPKKEERRVGPVVRAAELPAVEVPGGAVCGYQVRGGICGKAAVFGRGSRYFCQEH